MEIYIVRHGQTVWNACKRLQGRTDIELNEKGRELAGETGRNLEGTHFDIIYSSPLIRAYETACLIRGHRNIPIIRDDRLMELCFGIYEGRDFSKLLEDENDPFHYFFESPEKYVAPEEGETFKHLCERAKDFMQEVIEPLATADSIAGKPAPERVMIVAHGALLAGMMCYLDGHGVENFWGSGLKGNCEETVYNFDGKSWSKTAEDKIQENPYTRR